MLRTHDKGIIATKPDFDDGQITFDVEQVAARHRDVAGWSFRIYDPMPNSRTYSVPVMLSTTESNEQKIERADKV